MGPDAIAAMEARLLAVERRCVRLEDDTRDLARKVGLSRQTVWESWSDNRARPPVVVVAAGHTTGLCGGIHLPDSLPYTDTRFGSGTLDWDSSSSSWKRCVSGLTSPSNAAVTFALHYEAKLSANLTTLVLSLSWASDASSRPVNSTCSDATSPATTGQQPTSSTQTCPPTTYKKIFITNNSIATSTLYNSNAQTITIGPVAPV